MLIKAFSEDHQYEPSAQTYFWENALCTFSAVEWLVSFWTVLYFLAFDFHWGFNLSLHLLYYSDVQDLPEQVLRCLLIATKLLLPQFPFSRLRIWSSFNYSVYLNFSSSLSSAHTLVCHHWAQIEVELRITDVVGSRLSRVELSLSSTEHETTLNSACNNISIFCSNQSSLLTHAVLK